MHAALPDPLFPPLGPPVGATCGTPSPLYASTIPSNISRKALITRGEWETKAHVKDDEDRAERMHLQHFS